jgi:methylmalonyl-CoA mutase C-terminal domain/subunit
LIVGGGVIPEGDKQILEKQGITGNFGPGTALSIIIDHIRTNVKNLRLNNEENGK